MEGCHVQPYPLGRVDGGLAGDRQRANSGPGEGVGGRERTVHGM